MKKYFILLFIFLISSCSLFDYKGDPDGSFITVDYENYINGNTITFPKNTDALHIFNCLYNTFGYGSFSCNGTYSHTESAKLNGKLFTDTITKNITKFEISHDTDVDKNTFTICFTTDKNEILTYIYKWQFHNSNIWENTILDGEFIINY